MAAGPAEAPRASSREASRDGALAVSAAAAAAAAGTQEAQDASPAAEAEAERSLRRTTEAFLQTLGSAHRVSGKHLLRVLDQNRLACEGLQATRDAGEARLQCELARVAAQGGPMARIARARGVAGVAVSPPGAGAGASSGAAGPGGGAWAGPDGGTTTAASPAAAAPAGAAGDGGHTGHGDGASDEGLGLFGEVLFSLGLLAPEAPAQALPDTPPTPPPQRAPAPPAPPAPPVPAGAPAGLEEALALLEGQATRPARAVRATARLLHELRDLGRRAARLRGSWPAVKEAVARSRQAKEPLAINSLVWTLREALSWRRGVALAAQEVDGACVELDLSLAQSRGQQEERLRWRELSGDLLRGLARGTAARVAAVLWLRAARGAAAGSAEAGGGRPAELGGVLARNLEVADALDRRLVKCAGLAMRVETEADLVHQAVKRLSALRRDLADASERAERDAAASRRALAEPRPTGVAGAEAAHAASRALRELLQAIDEVGGLVGGGGGVLQAEGRGRPPRLVLEGGLAIGAEPADKADPGEVAAFRRWLREEVMEADEAAADTGTADTEREEDIGEEEVPEDADDLRNI